MSGGILYSQTSGNLQINFSGMEIHLGQKFELRIVNKWIGTELTRTKINSLELGEFTLNFTGLEIGRDYYVDFYADHNGNMLYDAPPIDHAYRLDLENTMEDNQLQFVHSGDFTDINWTYTVNTFFIDFEGHSEDLFEVRLREKISGLEVSRGKIDSLPEALFNIQLPGVELNKDYVLEFFADYNSNKIYDAPPEDHAWSFDFTSMAGDINLEFTHDADWTDIEWDYFYYLNLFDMGDHQGQDFFIRLVDQDTGSRTSTVVELTVPADNFTVAVPGLKTNINYNVDFYVDRNYSGTYDAPPVDHAWRLNAYSTTGNLNQEFIHTADFTDINWSAITSVEEDEVDLPMSIQLFQNYPNPFNPSTTIEFTLSEAAFVQLEVYNIIGQKISTILEDNMTAGLHSVIFTGDKLNSGIYFYKLTANNRVKTKKMILVK